MNMCTDTSKQEFTTYRHCTGIIIVSVYSHSIIIIIVESVAACSDMLKRSQKYPAPCQQTSKEMKSVSVNKCT